MNKKTEFVFAGFIKLTDSEKQEFIEELRKYRESTLQQKQVIEATTRSEMTKMTLGPLGGACPCCGK